MTQLPAFTPTLDDRLTAEFLEQSLALLTPPMVVPPAQDFATLDAMAWRFEKPEPPRDPDLPLLPAKDYPHPDLALVEATIRAMQPPPPIAGLVGRRTELDRAVSGLINDRAVLITGEPGIGKTALLRQIAADPRVRKRFRRIWWFDTIDAAGDAVGLALELPHVLRADPTDQPKLVREFLSATNSLLLFDALTDAQQIAYAMQFGPGVVVTVDMLSEPFVPESASVEVELSGLGAESAAGLIGISDAGQLIERVSGNPRALKLLNALLTEDGLAPDDAIAVMGGTEADPGYHPVAALFSGSFGALPTEYQSVYRMLPISGPVALSDVSARFQSALAARRALSFLERRGFIERVGETIRAVYTPPDTAYIEHGSADYLTPIEFPARAFRRMSTAPLDSADPRIRARSLYQEGVRALEEHRDAEAEALLTESLALRQTHDHAHAAAETLMALARLAYLRAENTVAIRQLEAAAEAVHRLRDSGSLDVVRIALSRVYRRAGRLDAALSVLGDDAPVDDWFALYVARGEWNAALDVARRNPDAQAARRQTAYALLRAGQLDEALQAVASVDDYDARLTRAYVHHMQGNYEQALADYDRADTVAGRDQDRGALARAQACALAALGRLREAAIRVGAEGVWYESRLPRPTFARQQASHALYAALSLAQGDVDSAESAAQRALQSDGERPDPTARATAYHVLARAAEVRADRDVALKAFQAALNEREASRTRDEIAIGLTLHALADQYGALGDFERAIPNCRLALTHLADPNNRKSRLITLLALRELLNRAGRQAQMLEAGQQALDLALTASEIDLPTLGYVIAIHIQALHESGRSTRATQVLTEWLNQLARRAGEAFDSSAWQVQVLGIGLVVRSALSGGTGTNQFSLPLLRDLAEEALSLAELHVPATRIAWAARRDLGETLLANEYAAEAAKTFAPLVSETESPRVEAESPLIALRVRIGAARAAMALGQFAAAARHFDAAVPLEPDSLTRGRLIRESAMALSEAGDLTGAAARYTESLTMLDRERALDEHVGVLVDLGYTRLRLGQFGPAIETFESALSIVQELPEPTLMASVLVDLANAHHTLGQYRRAAATYRRALAYQSPPARSATLLALARTNMALSEYRQALADYQDALQLDPSSEIYRAAQLEVGAVYVALKQPRQAIESYQAALTLEGLDTIETSAIQRSLGQQYAILGKHDQARVYFEKAMQFVDDDQTGLTLRAIADGYRAQEQFPAALDAYRRALPQLDRAHYPVEYAAVQRAIGELTLDAGLPDEAVPMLESALDVERALPRQDGGRIVALLQRLAAAHELRNEIDRAIIRYHEALVYQDVRHAPDQYARTLYALGRLYAQVKRYGEAAKALEDALATEYSQVTPDQAAIEAGTKLLADVYHAQNRLEQAAELYRRIVTPEPLMSSPLPVPLPIIDETTEHKREGEPQPEKPVTPDPIREAAVDALAKTQREIERYRQTLQTARQSWVLLNRDPKPDLKSLAFICALQAQMHAALGEWDQSERSLTQMTELLAARRAELEAEANRAKATPASQALALLLSGQDQEDRRNYDQASACYQQALTVAEQRKLAPELMWVLRQKLGKRSQRTPSSSSNRASQKQ